MSETITFSDYEIFNKAIGDADKLNTEITTAETDINACKKQISGESVFMGPIADSCKTVFGQVSTKISSMKESLNDTKTVLSSASDNYKNGEITAAQTINLGTSSNVSASASAIAPHSNASIFFSLSFCC